MLETIWESRWLPEISKTIGGASAVQNRKLVLPVIRSRKEVSGF